MGGEQSPPYFLRCIMKAVKINFAGKDFYMAMTAEAMFDLRDLSGDKTILKLIQPATKEARTYLFKAVSILTEAAELARRYMGYDKCLHHLTEKAIEAMATPDDILNMKVAVAEAIALGYNREINDPEKEVDLVLQELEKKTN